MKLTVTADIQQLIEQRMRLGKYSTPEEVVVAALHALSADERDGEFEQGEWDKLLEDGELSGKPLDGEEVFAALRKLRQHRRPQQKAG